MPPACREPYPLEVAMPGRSNSLVRVALALLLPSLLHAAPLGTAFTYQGELKQAGVPVNGTVHLRFSLWDAAGTGAPPVGGVQIGALDAAPNVPIAAGRFSVEVNAGGEFGSQAFDGQARWLQIEVCDDSACTSTTVLGPRQPLTAAPYALGPWQLAGANLGYAGGSVGIGTTSPLDLLHVNGQMRWGGATSSYVYSSIDGSGMFIEHKGSSTATSRLRIQSSKSGDQLNYSQFNIDPTNGASFLTFGSGNGNLGLGTQTPAAKLDVRGSIRLGNSGEYFAPGVPENIRILRGYVNSGGVVLEGTGFTATRTATGRYTITFTTAFPANEPPTVSVTGVGSVTTTSIATLYNATTVNNVFVRVTNASGTEVDSGFHFIAMGLR